MSVVVAPIKGHFIATDAGISQRLLLASDVPALFDFLCSHPFARRVVSSVYRSPPMRLSRYFHFLFAKD